MKQSYCGLCAERVFWMEEIMRTETDEIRDNLKYLTLLARDYPSQAAAASEIISTQALLKLPKGTEHFTVSVIATGIFHCR